MMVSISSPFGVSPPADPAICGNVMAGAPTPERGRIPRLGMPLGVTEAQN